ncbi:MAG: argD ornithine--oxo-acid transaminase [Pseudomonadota bacterium]|jgi:ornithine--oxo-acid transaminase
MSDSALKQAQLEQIKTFSANNYKPIPVVLARGEGVWVWDSDGRKYLDCLAAYSAVNQGHRHPKIIQALKDQADRLTLSSRAFHNDQMGPFLQKVCEMTGVGMVRPQALPMNSGAEAVETAIKIARKWGYEKKKVPQDQAEIIVCRDNFHGRTTAIVGFSTEAAYRGGFGPFAPGFKIIPYGSIDALREAITPRTVGFLFEPIQGEGGVLIPPAGFLTQAKALCRENQVLFMDDEIQTGLGRTGRLLCWQHEPEAAPDLLILGKALGGGVIPVSAVVAPQEVMEVIRPGEHGSTFGGNPLASAVGIASLDVIESEKLVERSAARGEYLRRRLQEAIAPVAHRVQEIRGKGLMTGVDLAPSVGKARPICEKLAALGVLVKDTREQTIRITPPLVIEEQEIDWMCEQFREALAD